MKLTLNCLQIPVSSPDCSLLETSITYNLQFMTEISLAGEGRI